MRYCKTKIVAMPIPSTDDVAQIKAEKVMEEIGRIIDEENLKDTIDIIEKQINESDYTAMDLAAAFLKYCSGLTFFIRNISSLKYTKFSARPGILCIFHSMACELNVGRYFSGIKIFMIYNI